MNTTVFWRVTFLNAVAGVEQQVAVGQRPEVIALPGGIFPPDFTLGVDDEDLAGGVVGANERMAFAFLDRLGGGGGLLLGAKNPRGYNCQRTKANSG